MSLEELIDETITPVKEKAELYFLKTINITVAGKKMNNNIPIKGLINIEAYNDYVSRHPVQFKPLNVEISEEIVEEWKREYQNDKNMVKKFEEKNPKIHEILFFDRYREKIRDYVRGKILEEERTNRKF